MINQRSIKGYLIGFVVCLLIVLFVLGWIPRAINRSRIDALAAQKVPLKVALLEIKPNSEPITLVLPSSAQAWHITPIWARTNGYIKNFLHDIGDRVREGDLLAEIDTPEVDENVSQAEANLRNAIAERDIAKVTSERWQKLWDKNREAVSKQEVDQYNANTQSAEAVVAANISNLASLTYLQDFKFVTAPFDGIITQRSIDIGSLIYGNINETPQQLFQIAQIGTIRFFVDVPQTYFRQIQEGLEAQVSVEQFPGQIFKGHVTRFANALDPTARTLLTEVDVDNPKGVIYPGLFGRVTFLIKQDTLNFMIPTTALIIRSGYPHVAVVDQNNTVHLKQVEIGRDYGNKMEITQGLATGDRIITIPNDKIRNGVKVQPE